MLMKLWAGNIQLGKNEQHQAHRATIGNMLDACCCCILLILLGLRM